MEEFIKTTLKKDILEIDFEDIEKIIANKEETDKILWDELIEFIENENEYYKMAKKSEYNSFYPIHLIFILAEMEVNIATELIGLLKSLDDDKRDFWFGGILTEELWYVFYKLGKMNLTKVKEFVFDINNYLYVRGSIIRGLFRLEMEEKEYRKDIIDIMKKIILDKNEDVDMKGIVIGAALEMNAREIEDEIKIVAKEIDNMQFFVSSKNLSFNKIGEREFYIKDFKEIYENFLKYTECEEYRKTKEKERSSNYFGSPQEQRKIEKVGRNEPCPCGSGKKYKKCCGK